MKRILTHLEFWVKHTFDKRLFWLKSTSIFSVIFYVMRIVRLLSWVRFVWHLKEPASDDFLTDDTPTRFQSRESRPPSCKSAITPAVFMLQHQD